MRTSQWMLLVLFALASFPQVSLANREVIVATGDDVPDGVGKFRRFPSAPVLNLPGDAAFLSATSSNPSDENPNLGFYLGNPLDIEAIALEGDAVSGGGNLGTFESISLNDEGQASFVTFLNNTGGGDFDDEAIFLGDGETLTTIAREGMVAPDGNGSFATFFSGALLNHTGEIAFQSFLNDTSAAPFDDSGLFRSNGSTVTQIVREGDALASGDGSFGVNVIPGAGEMAINSLGSVAFMETLTDTPSGSGDNFGLYRGNGGALTQIARKGDAAPDGNGVFGGGGSVFSTLALNENDQAAFRGQLTDTAAGTSDDTGLFLGDGSNLTQIVREGQPAPDPFGTNGIFSSFQGPAFNDNGELAFAALLVETNGGVFDNTGVFIADGNSVHSVARRSEAAPDEDRTDGAFSSFSDLAINNESRVVFQAQLSGTSDGSGNDEGLFLYDPTRGLRSVIREGDELLDSTVTSFLFADGQAENGLTRSGFNDLGQVAFQFTLADGNQGIAVYTPDFGQVEGDYNNDGVVNAADYTVWRDHLGTDGPLPNDPIGGEIGHGQYELWRTNFGMVASASGIASLQTTNIPEPTGLALSIACMLFLLRIRNVRS